jgi:hypothetical protein
LATSTACFHVVKEAAENGFAADFWSVSGDGRNFRCCTVGELLRDCDWVSVRAVQEKCDEKGRDPAWAKLGLAANPIAIVLPGNTLEHLSAVSYVEREEKREQFRQDALAAWTHYQTTGLHATAEKADAWLARLEAGKDTAPPKCYD